jgi:hypothetical protein
MVPNWHCIARGRAVTGLLEPRPREEQANRLRLGRDGAALRDLMMFFWTMLDGRIYE